jgi:hypothetical protein
MARHVSKIEDGFATKRQRDNARKKGRTKRQVGGADRRWAGSGKVLIEAAAVAEYLQMIKARTLDTSRCEVTNSIRQTDIERLSQLANSRPSASFREQAISLR